MRAVMLLVLALSATAVAFAIKRQPQNFPHERHAHLFPLCAGCHEGVPEGDRARFYPSPQVCASCHDGTTQPRVTWTAPQIETTNLRFSHPAHNETEPLDCSQCHTREGAQRMAVQHTVSERCFACHAPQATSHFTDAPCSQCHIPLAQTRFAASRVQGLPKPASHARPNFLEDLHGGLARTQQAQCVVCHTREQCAACHVDATRRAEVVAMPAAQSVALPPAGARYFTPASHKRPDWIERHGAAAANITECAACHTRETCSTCHAAKLPKSAAGLVSRKETTAPGVAATRRAPASHQAPFFGERHGAAASAGQLTCMGCHERPQCEQCHNAQTSGRTVSLQETTRPATPRPQQQPQRRAADFHPANFVQRHASAAYGRRLECSNCHDTSRFCRACHEQMGMNTVGRLQAGFHDAQPLFLFNHGKPARQGLETCASCHKQNDCLQCHSTIGSFRVNPHGPGFKPERVQARNAKLCYACHLTDPTQR